MPTLLSCESGALPRFPGSAPRTTAAGADRLHQAGPRGVRAQPPDPGADSCVGGGTPWGGGFKEACVWGSPWGRDVVDTRPSNLSVPQRRGRERRGQTSPHLCTAENTQTRLFPAKPPELSGRAPQGRSVHLRGPEAPFQGIHRVKTTSIIALRSPFSF